MFIYDSLWFVFLQAWCVWSPAARWWSSSCFCVHRQVSHLYLSFAFPPIWFTLRAVNSQPWLDSELPRLISSQHYLVYFSTYTSSLSDGRETGEKATLAANIGPRVKGGRPVRVTSDPSAGPCGPAKLMRRDNVDLMVLCIDYPSRLCCLVGVLLPSLFSCNRIHEY